MAPTTTMPIVYPSNNLSIQSEFGPNWILSHLVGPPSKTYSGQLGLVFFVRNLVGPPSQSHVVRLGPNWILSHPVGPSSKPYLGQIGPMFFVYNLVGPLSKSYMTRTHTFVQMSSLLRHDYDNLYSNYNRDGESLIKLHRL